MTRQALRLKVRRGGEKEVRMEGRRRKRSMCMMRLSLSKNWRKRLKGKKVLKSCLKVKMDKKKQLR